MARSLNVQLLMTFVNVAVAAPRGTRAQKQLRMIQDKMTYGENSLLQCHSDARDSLFYSRQTWFVQ